MLLDWHRPLLKMPEQRHWVLGWDRDHLTVALVFWDGEMWEDTEGYNRNLSYWAEANLPSDVVLQVPKKER